MFLVAYFILMLDHHPSFVVGILTAHLLKLLSAAGSSERRYNVKLSAERRYNVKLSENSDHFTIYGRFPEKFTLYGRTGFDLRYTLFFPTPSSTVQEFIAGKSFLTVTTFILSAGSEVVGAFPPEVHELHCSQSVTNRAHPQSLRSS